MSTFNNPFALSLSKGEHSAKRHSWFDKLMEQLAIRLGCQKTTAKSLVITTNGFRLSKQSGFTLLEVLVALAILAITMAAVSRTASSSIHHVEALRTRVIADWVAQNRLAQHQARGDWPAPGIQTGEEAQAGQTYPWQEEVIATPNPTMRRIVVSVYAPDDAKHSLRELTGYLVLYPR
jgi:general secretion pathway protein I